MKSCRAIILFCFIFLTQAYAQETVTISLPDFQEKEILRLTTYDKWIYTQEKTDDWASPEADTRLWKKLNPFRIPFDFADENGLVEMWFRLQLTIDSNLIGQTVYFNLLTNSAARMFINGEYYDESGHPDHDSKLNQSAGDYLIKFAGGWVPVPIVLDTNHYTIAVYITDHDRALFSKKTFKRLTTGFNVNMFSGKVLGRQIKMLSEYKLFQGIWLNGLLLLTLLFLVLLLLDRNEKTLRWIALLTTSLTCSALMDYAASNYFRGIWMYDIQDLFYYGFLGIAVGLIPITISQIILKRVDRPLKILFWIVASLYPVIWYFSGIPLMQKSYYYVMGFVLIIISCICVYIIIKNRKQLHTAEWSLVWGLIIMITWMLLHTLFINIGFSSNVYRLSTVALIYLSLPISFLVFISIRYNDNIKTLRKNINEISTLTDEKLKAQEEKQRLISAQNETLERKIEERTQQLRDKNKVLSEANEEIQRQRDEVISSRNDLESTLINLKATQAQLVQSEKMASLGELTAGIAHEIQNPLNFVNNFSEINNELIDEMKQELTAGHLADALNIAEDIKSNEEKIAHHGKRADAIVKGMLLHSRTGSGISEPTDINALCDEYLRLAYHGLRAKDKAFNAKMETDFDDSLGKINVVQQDIGRVILNIITNAFWAVNEKNKMNLEHFEPTVSISTKKMNDTIAIQISDNGNGIPEDILSKIFQPFFTTKPTGQGTGLGLSLSYDIIQAHGGQLDVKTKEGEGTEFIIQLPVTLIQPH